MNRPKARAERVCSICGTTQGAMTRYSDGYVCETCSTKTLEGRDATTQAIKLKQNADRLQADQLKGFTGYETSEAIEYIIASGHLMAEEVLGAPTTVQNGSGGEAGDALAGSIVATLRHDSITALDASNHRIDLVTMVGNDIAAMAFDAAISIEAQNSLETMFAHEMVALHNFNMRMFHRANLTEDPDVAVKFSNAAMKGVAIYQKGLGTLAKLRGNQNQQIVVQRVNVNSGGQAMVGNVSTRAGQP